MSRVLVCDGCGKPAAGETLILPFRGIEGADYCAACMPAASAFYKAAGEARDRLLLSLREEFEALRKEHAPDLRSVPLPLGSGE